MIYIIAALKSEAQGIVDKYKLKKDKLNSYTIFNNEKITLIISGIGIINSNNATGQILKHFKKNEDDTYLNIGICGANTCYTIGELIEISSIKYMNKTVIINDNEKNLINCLDNEATNDTFDIVDMESFGFYQATKGVKNVRIFKVVSDNFRPELVTKQKTKTLIFNTIEDIIDAVTKENT